MKKLFTTEKLSSLFFYFSILIFIIGFNFTDSPPSFGWYQQFMPNLNNQLISDIFFLDSLSGWAVTNDNTPQDTGYILKTTNGGDNWTIKYQDKRDFSRIMFINSNTGFTCGGTGSGTSYLYKSTNGGDNWYTLPVLGNNFYTDMSVLNNDTIWLVDPDGLLGGVFFTSNGGQNWIQQMYLVSNNPNKIYMFNRNIGFISTSGAQIYKTTNSGVNWTLKQSNEVFTDMFFADSLTGWKAGITMKKTTDGGNNWSLQVLPHGGLISMFGSMQRFKNINRDTIWGVGGYLDYGGGRERAIIYRTINGGANWEFQLPDTAFGIPNLTFINFVDRLRGWAYSSYFSQPVGGIISSGVSTISGGDTTNYSGIKKISSNEPLNFILYQNYPNPFNPVTNINYKISKTSNVLLEVFDINGRRLKILVKQKQSAGEYTVKFDGSSVSSGVYFYRLQITNEKGGIEDVETKKAILVK